jgi:hypothetical protein
MSHSGEILDRQIRDVHPKEHQGEDLNIRVWAILQIDEFIKKIGWIEHTNDWDLFYEITLSSGEIYFCLDVTPLNAQGEPYTEENGVNDYIEALKIGDWHTDQDDGSSEDPKVFKLTDIDRIYFG